MKRTFFILLLFTLYKELPAQKAIRLAAAKKTIATLEGEQLIKSL